MSLNLKNIITSLAILSSCSYATTPITTGDIYDENGQHLLIRDSSNFGKPDAALDHFLEMHKQSTQETTHQNVIVVYATGKTGICTDVQGIIADFLSPRGAANPWNLDHATMDKTQPFRDALSYHILDMQSADINKRERNLHVVRRLIESGIIGTDRFCRLLSDRDQIQSNTEDEYKKVYKSACYDRYPFQCGEGSCIPETPLLLAGARGYMRNNSDGIQEFNFTCIQPGSYDTLFEIQENLLKAGHYPFLRTILNFIYNTPTHSNNSYTFDPTCIPITESRKTLLFYMVEKAELSDQNIVNLLYNMELYPFETFNELAMSILQKFEPHIDATIYMRFILTAARTPVYLDHALLCSRQNIDINSEAFTTALQAEEEYFDQYQECTLPQIKMHEENLLKTTDSVEILQLEHMIKSDTASISEDKRPSVLVAKFIAEHSELFKQQ